jgi:hypothetical protein
MLHNFDSMDGSGSTQSKRTSAAMTTKARADYRAVSTSLRQAQRC